MQHFHCFTNLDLPSEKWPTELPRIPCEGEEIFSMTNHGSFKLCLTVVKVRWIHTDWDGYWAEVELHDRQPRSIREFYEWYAPLVGRDVASFI